MIFRASRERPCGHVELSVDNANDQFKLKWKLSEALWNSCSLAILLCHTRVPRNHEYKLSKELQ